MTGLSQALTGHGLCACGCGRPTSVAKKTRARLGHTKGQPVRFVQGHAGCWTAARKSERFVVEDTGHTTPCHIWRLVKVSTGYGQEWCNDRGRMAGAHVLAYERAHGPVPDGLELDHLCRQRDCVNPDHLEPVTHEENIRRGDYSTHWQGRTRDACGQFQEGGQ